jgi:pimeloyl-ACP methyl ester carboxylesterase
MWHMSRSFLLAPLRLTLQAHPPALPCLALLCALLAGCAAPPETGLRRGAIELTECRLKDVSSAAWCGEWTVPENHDQPGGRKIRLHVAVLPAYVRTRAPDPLILLAGGPGQAASDIGKLALLFDTVRRARDIVLIDQRGTGRSHPFGCKLFDTLDPVVAMMQVAPDPAKLRECAAGFDGDPRQYTTPAFLHDLESVRTALGVEQVNLWGGSYGSRVALAYLRAHPDRIRTVILDGVATTAMRIMFEALTKGEAQLAATIADCGANPACNAAYPRLVEDWARLSRDYAQERPVTITHPRTGLPQTLVADFLVIDGALRTLLYSAEYSAMIPELITRAAAGDMAPLFAAALRIVGDLGQGMNVGLQLSVVCAEDGGRVSADDLAGARAYSIAATVLGRIESACNEWPHGSVPAEFHQPTTSAKPVLVFSGGLDPVTPAANGELAVRTLAAATHIIAPGYGHLVSPFSCAPRLVARFVDDGNAEHLPEDCVKALRASKRPPFFVGRLEARP